MEILPIVPRVTTLEELELSKSFINLMEIKTLLVLRILLEISSLPEALISWSLVMIINQRSLYPKVTEFVRVFSRNKKRDSKKTDNKKLNYIFLEIIFLNYLKFRFFNFEQIYSYELNLII